MRLVPILALLAACAGDVDPPVDTDADAGPSDTLVDVDQLPPEGGDAVEAWLAAGAYLDWACEADAHPARPPGAHGENRICSNAALSAHGDGPYPVDAASVKELVEDGEIVGYAVARKVADGDGGGAWWWYERKRDHTYADGRGDAGLAAVTCVPCHAAAGSDADHAGHDFVYTQVGR